MRYGKNAIFLDVASVLYILLQIILCHHFNPSSSPVVSLSSGILHEWMRMQILAEPFSNFLQRTVHCYYYYYLCGAAGADLFIIITTCAGLQVPICSLLLLHVQGCR